MTLQGTVINGVVVLDNGNKVPEGTRVRVLVDDEKQLGQSLRDFLLGFAGSCPGLPSDLAEQHDHYLYGTPKQCTEYLPTPISS